jgi:hypothetical protein
VGHLEVAARTDVAWGRELRPAIVHVGAVAGAALAHRTRPRTRHEPRRAQLDRVDLTRRCLALARGSLEESNPRDQPGKLDVSARNGHTDTRPTWDLVIRARLQGPVLVEISVENRRRAWLHYMLQKSVTLPEL